MSIASWMSPPASALTFPISRVITSDSAGFSRSRSCAKRKRMFPRSGAGTSRHSSHASPAARTARSTSSAVERGNCSITSPVDGFSESKVAVAIEGDPTGAGSGLRDDVRVGERPRDARAAPVGDLAALLELARILAGAPIGAFAAVDDHRHVRVVPVVLDHLLVELALELAWDDAIDHALTIRIEGDSARAVRRPSRGGRCPGRAVRRPPCARSTR